MKRTLIVTLVLASVLFVIFTTRMISQQQLLAWQDARTAEVRQDTQDEAPPPVSVLGEPGGAGAASPPKLPDDAESQISDTANNPANNTELQALPPIPQASKVVPEQVERLKRAESFSQLLKKLYPNMPLEVLPVGDAVLLRGDVGSKELHHQVVAISEQFFPKVLAQLQVQPSKLPRADQTEAEAAKPVLIGDDKHGLREMFGKLYPTAKLEVNVLTDNAVLIRGRVAWQVDIRPIFDIAQQFAPKVLIYVTADDQQSTLAPVAGSLAGSGGATEIVGGVSRLPTTNVTPRDDQDIAMDLEAKQMALRVHAAKEPEKSKLRAELEKLTEKHFEHRQQRRKQEIDDMADRVDKLRVAHHQRQENKPDILKRRLADLLDEDNQLKWDDARNQPAQSRVPATGTVAAPVVNPPDMTSAAVHSPLPLTAQVIEALSGRDSDLVRLHGVWGIESVEPGAKLPHGLTLRIDALKGEGLIIPDRPGLDGRHLGDVMFRLGIQSSKVRFILNETTQPKRIDFTAQGDGEPVKTIYGIYTTANNKLTMVFGPPGEARPQSFDFLPPKHVRIQLSRRPKPVDVAVPALNIDGEWLVTLPAGFEFVGKIAKQPNGVLSFTEMRGLSGDYKLEGDTFKRVLTSKDDPRDVFEWLMLNDNVLVLTKAPQHIGSDYRGATLRRGAKPKVSLERSQSESTPSSEEVLTARLRKAEVVLKSAKLEFNRLESRVKVSLATRDEVIRAGALVEEAEADVGIASAELREARQSTQPKGQ